VPRRTPTAFQPPYLRGRGRLDPWQIASLAVTWLHVHRMKTAAMVAFATARFAETAFPDSPALRCSNKHPLAKEMDAETIELAMQK